MTCADVVETEILDAVDAKLVLKLPPPLAASACVLLAVHGQVDAVVGTMERIAHSTKRRALLLLGAFGLADRDREAATGLLALLENGHAASRLLDLADGEQLPASALSDLGHIRIRKVVQEWLNEKFVKE